MADSRQIVIPMSGRGARFQRAGYAAIKPLIAVDGSPMIAHVLSLFPGEKEVLFVCARDHLETTPLRAVLERLSPGATIASIEPHKRGPVHTALEAKEAIRDDAAIVLSYCDFSLDWDYPRFVEYVERTQCDGCIVTYRGFHPHSLGPNLYGYLREERGRVLEIREKACFTSNKMQEHASAGIYYFRSGKILKRYFELAVQKGLDTKGEYFASLPYNLMIADGLDVRLFEIDHFLQWGTPEDLREYQSWSDHFARESEWKPQKAVPGTTLIPMAGEGARFKKEGYLAPKPFVPVDGIPIVERVLRSLPLSPSTLLVTTEPIARHPAASELLRSRQGAAVVRLAGPTEGAVCTCLAAEAQVDPQSPLLIAACDAGFVYDEKKWNALQASSNVDFIVWTFRDHPHANRNPLQYAWVQTDAKGRIERITCKELAGPISEVSRQPGVTGTFWFRRAGDFFDAARELLAKGVRVNGEFYVDSVVAALAGRSSGRIFEVSRFLCFGTPDDVRTYEYWARYFRKKAVERQKTHAIAAS